MKIRYWAAARAAAGCNEESVEAPTDLSVADLISLLVEKHDAPDFTRIVQGCSVLIDGRSVSRSARAETFVRLEQTVEFLPPFAGG